MKQTDLLKAMAIVNIFETGNPYGEFGTVAVLKDGAGISYGISQFTHKSGSLAAVIERYLELGGAVGRFVLENALANFRRKEPVVIRAYSKDERVMKALRAAAVTKEMRVAQLQIAFERYLQPALKECERLGFELALSVAVIHDSMTHGSYEKIRDRVGGIASSKMVSNLSESRSLSAHRTAEPQESRFEKKWITEYVRTRDRWLASIPRLNATRYRTRFFLNQIMLGSWELKLPLNVNGFWLRDEYVTDILKFADGTIGSDLAVWSNSDPHTIKDTTETLPSKSSTVLTPTPQAQPPTTSVSSPHVSKGSSHDDPDVPAADTYRSIRKGIEIAIAQFDTADRIVSGIAYRTDRAKSLWTTVIGTIWQTVWAIFSFVIGLPRVVWLAVAIIVAALMLFYLYRQIALGKLRELK